MAKASEDQIKIIAYIKKQQAWAKLLAALRKILCSSELSETVKWGAPAYTLDGKLLITIAGFKNHCGIWFHQGVFLKDSKNKLCNAQEGVTRGMRQWRFEAGDVIDSKLVKAYIEESIRNERAGKRIVPQRKKSLTLPSELSAALDKNSSLKKKFSELTPGRQREYANHIASAKQEKTRLSRLEKATPLILQGGGLFDKYKNC